MTVNIGNTLLDLSEGEPSMLVFGKTSSCNDIIEYYVFILTY